MARRDADLELGRLQKIAARTWEAAIAARSGVFGILVLEGPDPGPALRVEDRGILTVLGNPRSFGLVVDLWTESRMLRTASSNETWRSRTV